MMKRILACLLALVCLTAAAQPGYRGRQPGGRHDAPHGDAHGYEVPVSWSILGGWNFSHISSDGSAINASGARSGSYVGVGVNMPVSPMMPLMFSTGLMYSTKGGVSKDPGAGNMKYTLGYLEVPLGFSYQMPLSPRFAVEPYFGAYLAGGISGKIKNYTTKTTTPSFGDQGFRRMDCGFRLGCDFSLLIFQVSLYYDLGLTNISREDFISAYNRSISLALGFNF